MPLSSRNVTSDWAIMVWLISSATVSLADSYAEATDMRVETSLILLRTTSADLNTSLNFLILWSDIASLSDSDSGRDAYHLR